jgi:nitroimidazol reductase NimA-like FMN-containing flavoprotein (pyridoxamine 5'-phosphate oxidase superfamily)
MTRAPALSGAVMTELDRAQCLELLRTSPIGRVVLSVNCLPVALPVNIALLDGNVVFATGEGSILEAALHRNVLSVESDAIEPLYHSGWSVLVTGTAAVMSEPGQLERARRLPLAPWAPGPHPYYVVVPSTIVSGRRIEPRSLAASGR